MSNLMQADAELIRETERKRLRALVDVDVVVARALHADDFQLINPRGETLSRDEYLDGIASGQVNYLVFEPVSAIDVRVYEDAAAIRYRSKLEVIVHGQHLPLHGYWHTDVYERRDGRWHIVWSHATAMP